MIETEQMAQRLQEYLLSFADSPELTPLPSWAIPLLAGEDWPNLEQLPANQLEAYYLMAFPTINLPTDFTPSPADGSPQ